jgi:hypothetical protein
MITSKFAKLYLKMAFVPLCRFNKDVDEDEKLKVYCASEDNSLIETTYFQKIIA